MIHFSLFFCLNRIFLRLALFAFAPRLVNALSLKKILFREGALRFPIKKASLMDAPNQSGLGS